MELPFYENACIDIEKLKDYCLNPYHPVGKNKARVFQSLLDLDQNDALWLKNEIFKKLSSSPATEKELDKYGRRYEVEMEIENGDLRANVTTVWILAQGTSYPRFITCYIKA